MIWRRHYRLLFILEIVMVAVPGLEKEDKEQVAEEWETMALKNQQITDNKCRTAFIIEAFIFEKEKAVFHATRMVSQKRRKQSNKREK